MNSLVVITCVTSNLGTLELKPHVLVCADFYSLEIYKKTQGFWRLRWDADNLTPPILGGDNLCSAYSGRGKGLPAESTCLERSFLWTGAGVISKKALVSREKVFYSKAAGGKNILHICCWNRAAILKQLWALAKEKECLWIKWVHNYYSKQESLENCQPPKNATWVVRKIIEARQYVLSLGSLQGNLLSRLELVVVSQKYSIKKMYVVLRPLQPQAPWKHLLLQPQIHLRHKFILWLALQRILATIGRLLKFGVQVPPSCIFYKGPDETMDHLFFNCLITKNLWQRVLLWIGEQRQIGN
ncbi:uncharacterized protein LOC132045026 [Lycium ferocissimum]|uniref:uncharacterized protein LOC132045026 n=1 Tax=Lycium ferocissimum TaxID=112874 RepID=UPI002814D55C|nr:uncharacterized protein LOC132045026 [Lycium ferocissimum]